MNSISIEQQAINLIRRSNKILIIPSSPPDGDSLGGALALYLALKKIGKNVTAVCTDLIPDIYTFLPHEAVILNKINLNRDFIVTLDCNDTKVDHLRYTVEHNKVNVIISPKKGHFTDKNVSFHHGPIKYDLIIAVDAGELGQLGKIYEDTPNLFYEIPVLNIDHHASNTDFGKVNLVDMSASATTEILYSLIRHLDTEKSLMDEEISTLLLTGIITDTGSFQNANTTPKSLEIAGELVDMGAHQQDIIKNVYKTKKLTTLKLWGKILSQIEFDAPHRFLWSIITEKDFKETDSEPSQTGDVIDNLLVNTPGGEIILLLKEKSPNLLSGSLRTTQAGIDASKIAELFGGGGHNRAAGFKITTTNLIKSEKEVIEKIKAYQAQRLNLLPAEEELPLLPVLIKPVGKTIPLKIEKPLPPVAPLIKKEPPVSVSKNIIKVEPPKPSVSEINVESKLSPREDKQEKIIDDFFTQIIPDNLKAKNNGNPPINHPEPVKIEPEKKPSINNIAPQVLPSTNLPNNKNPEIIPNNIKPSPIIPDNIDQISY